MRRTWRRIRRGWAKLTGNRRVNRWALLILTVAVLVAAGGVYFVHGWQVQRNARGLYEQAEQAQREGNARQAADYLQHYLGMVPEDTEALTKYGLLLNQLAKKPREYQKALNVLEQVLRRDEGNEEVRRAAAKIANLLGQFPAAEGHLQVLLKARPDDAELMREFARSKRGQRRYDDAAEWYRKAVKADPARADFALEYAVMLQLDQKLEGVAEDVIFEMWNRAPRSADVRMKAAAYYRRFNKPDEAWTHVTAALDNMGTPGDELLLLAGDVALARGDWDEARRQFDEGRRRFPTDTRMSHGLARVDLARGDPRHALEHLRQSLKTLPT
jgi:tetratricopeptide (TPR) repeat protein